MQWWGGERVRARRGIGPIFLCEGLWGGPTTKLERFLLERIPLLLIISVSRHPHCVGPGEEEVEMILFAVREGRN